MSEIPGRVITYCTNIHPGESWDETFAFLRAHIPAVKAAVSPETSFPIGLRLSSRAAQELAAGSSHLFSDWLRRQDCFVPTINVFPFGSFHGAVIKERVYLPDWRSPQRVVYTSLAARLLADWLPPGMAGSLSTVPVGFKGQCTAADLPRVRVNLLAALEDLAAIHRQTGKEILLALEPEPACFIESSADLCECVAALNLPGHLRRFLGVCLDACHLAIQFEEPADVLARFAAAGIPIAKVQASSALAVVDPDPRTLERFCEPYYLHQVVIRRRDGSLVRYDDLPAALSLHEAQTGDEWRCHFHLPLFFDGSTDCSTTRPFLQGLLPLMPLETLFEVETYTWEVLPAALRCSSVNESITRELHWLKEQLNAAYGCS